MNRKTWGALAGLLLAAASWAQESMPVMELTAGMHRIEAEVAANDQNRQVGLMNRRVMPPQRGMLFVFGRENTHCMWMRNTYLPLSVAFVDADGVIINIVDMHRVGFLHQRCKPRQRPRGPQRVGETRRALDAVEERSNGGRCKS